MIAILSYETFALGLKLTAARAALAVWLLSRIN